MKHIFKKCCYLASGSGLKISQLVNWIFIFYSATKMKHGSVKDSHSGKHVNMRIVQDCFLYYAL